MTPEQQLALAFRVAVRFGRRQHRGEIDDLVQDGVLRMLEATPFAPGPDRHEEAYYGWQARCGMVDGLRRGTSWNKRRRARFLTVIDIADLAKDECEPSTPPLQEDGYAREVLSERLQRAIDTLPPRDADIVRSYYYRDENIPAIARRLKLTQGRVSQLMIRARGQLRDALSKEDLCV